LQQQQQLLRLLLLLLLLMVEAIEDGFYYAINIDLCINTSDAPSLCAIQITQQRVISFGLAKRRSNGLYLSSIWRRFASQQVVIC
jgi:hypothetical protein